MSADNWAVCPSCLAVAEETKAAQARLAQEAYGHVEIEEFDRLRIEASTPINQDKLRTFREDYEFWMDGTVVNVSYDGRCTVCGTGVKFSDVRPIEMKRPKVKA